MDFQLSEEQALLVDTVRRFIARELSPLEQAIEDTGTLPVETARAVHAQAKALGLYAMNMPAQHGGGGLSTLDRILCEEQFGHTTDILIRRAFGNVYEPLLECRGEQVERWLKPAVAGTRTCAIAITEPGAGSDAAGIRTQARETPDGWVLDGGKHFISDAEWSDFFLVSARTGEGMAAWTAWLDALPRVAPAGAAHAHGHAHDPHHGHDHAHGHAHDHAHGHAHDHGPAHGPDRSRPAR